MPDQIIQNCNECPPEYWESLNNLGIRCMLPSNHSGDHWYKDTKERLSMVIAWENKELWPHLDSN